MHFFRNTSVENKNMEKEPEFIELLLFNVGKPQNLFQCGELIMKLKSKYKANQDNFMIHLSKLLDAEIDWLKKRVKYYELVMIFQTVFGKTTLLPKFLTRRVKLNTALHLFKVAKQYQFDIGCCSEKVSQIWFETLNLFIRNTNNFSSKWNHYLPQISTCRWNLSIIILVLETCTSPFIKLRNLRKNTQWHFRFFQV